MFGLMKKDYSAVEGVWFIKGLEELEGPNPLAHHVGVFIARPCDRDSKDDIICFYLATKTQVYYENRVKSQEYKIPFTIPGHRQEANLSVEQIYDNQVKTILPKLYIKSSTYALETTAESHWFQLPTRVAMPAWPYYNREYRSIARQRDD